MEVKATKTTVSCDQHTPSCRYSFNTARCGLDNISENFKNIPKIILSLRHFANDVRLSGSLVKLLVASPTNSVGWQASLGEDVLSNIDPSLTPHQLV